MVNLFKEKKIYIAIAVVLVVVLIVGFFGWQPKKQTVVSDDGLASLEIPNGALPDGVSTDAVSIRKNDVGYSDELLAVYTLEPEGLEFKEPARISIVLDVKAVPLSDGGGNGIALANLHHAHSGAAGPLSNQSGVVDLRAGKMTLSAPISGLSSVSAWKYHPIVRFTVGGVTSGETESVTIEGQSFEESDEGVIFYVGDEFDATAQVFYPDETLILKNSGQEPKDPIPPEDLDEEDLDFDRRQKIWRNVMVEFSRSIGDPKGLRFWRELHRQALDDLTISGGTFLASEYSPEVVPEQIYGEPLQDILELGENKSYAAKFTCKTAGGRILDLLRYGRYRADKYSGRVGYMEWKAYFTYKWSEAIYDKDSGFLARIESSIDKQDWYFSIPITCLPAEMKTDLMSAEGGIIGEEKKEAPESPGAPPVPADTNEARCTAVCGKNRYSPATSQQVCSDTSKDFLCIQNKQACYDYLIPKGWQNDSNCCCKDEPVARSAGSRIDCAKFVGWDVNGFAVEKNPKYPFSSATLPPAECK